jgi:hypothetical protein
VFVVWRWAVLVVLVMVKVMGLGSRMDRRDRMVKRGVPIVELVFLGRRRK